MYHFKLVDAVNVAKDVWQVTINLLQNGNNSFCCTRTMTLTRRAYTQTDIRKEIETKTFNSVHAVNERFYELQRIA